MTEQTVETQPTEGGETSGYTPPATQQDLDRIITERVKRVESKFADVKDARAKAAEYDKLVEANKSEAQKAQERITAAEAEVASIPAKVSAALRDHLVALHEINAEDAELFLTATDPELLLKQVSRLTGRESTRKKQGNHVPGEGTNPTAPKDEQREFVGKLFSAEG